MVKFLIKLCLSLFTGCSLLDAGLPAFQTSGIRVLVDDLGEF